ncbi:uncharacterized protein LOC106087719 [Stomoxys calcitrans]|uniref:Uncharacterized protein n=1 Tax=Stomoxys calcitrans TaxID=35570 RepID=A0A1I8P5C2_STOCA|nr:uncharacterized protein LOC106087719 [Stomoxys calcitrans]
MIYTRIKFVACVLVLALSVSVYANPGLKLREKLARLLMDPENIERNNEISQEDSQWKTDSRANTQKGMVLKNRPGSTRSKDRKPLKTMFEVTKPVESEESHESREYKKTSKTTTTTTPASDTTQDIVMVGMAPFKAIMNRILDIWN